MKEFAYNDIQFKKKNSIRTKDQSRHQVERIYTKHSTLWTSVGLKVNSDIKSHNAFFKN